MAQQIEFEGVVHEFPDDFSPEEISAALGGGGASTLPQTAPSVPQPAAPVYGPNNPEPGYGRAGHRAVDNVVGAAASVIGAPAELGKQVINAPFHAFNIPAKLLGYEGVNPPIQSAPALGFEQVKSTLGDLVRTVDPGYQPIAEENKTGRERLVDTAGQLAAAGGLTGAGLSTAAATRVATPGAGPRLSDVFLRTYADKPGRAVMADTLAGAGSGAGLEGYRQNAPESIAENPLGQLVASLIGGATGGVTVPIANSAANLPQRIQRGITGSGVPYDPQNPLMPIPNKVADKAAQLVQENAVDPYKALSTLKANRADFAQEGLPMPTSGLMSEDIGLNSIEKSSRLQNPVPFIKSDQALQRAAQDRVSSIRPDVPESELRAPQRYAEGEATKMRDAADQGVTQAENRFEAGRQAVTANREEAINLAAPVREQSGQGPAASRQLAEQTRGALEQRTAAKNEQFNNLPQTPVENTDRLTQTAQAIRASNNRLRPDEQLPTAFLDRLDRLTGRPPEDPLAPMTGRAPAERQPLTVSDLADTRKYLNTAANQAQSKGNFDLTDNLRDLKRHINEAIEQHPDAAAANDFYRTQYAPYFAEGRGGKMRDLTQRDPTGQKLPAEREAAFWLNDTEDSAQHLARIIRIAPNPQAAQTAARNFMVSDLARKVAPDGSINPVALRKWLDGNRGKMASPEFQPIYNEIEQLHRDVVNNRTQRNALNNDVVNLRRQVTQAQGSRAAVEQTIKEGALGVFIGRDPRHAVQAVFQSQDPAATAASVNKMIDTAPPAIRGGLKDAWHAIVADDLIRRTTNAMKDPGGEIGRVSYDKLTRMLRDNDGVLREVFRDNPEKLRQLNIGRKAIEPLLQRAQQATVGSPTAENFANTQAARLLEIGLKTWYGGLAGGNVFRNVKLGIKGLMGDNSAQVSRLMERAFTEDPRIMEQLLTRSYRTPNPGYNKPLNRALSATQASQDDTEEKRNELRIRIAPDAPKR